MIRNELQSWRKMNVAAFLAGGLFGDAPELSAEAYRVSPGWSVSRSSSSPHRAPTDDLDRMVSPSALRKDVDKIGKNLGLHP